MISDINIDKILQKQQNGNLYILHIIANSQLLILQIQDKMKGDIWYSQFPSQKIQQITLKAKNPKKYSIFMKMLMSSLLGQTQSVLVQILTYSELQKKMNISSRGRNIQNNKKYLIMTYMSQFDKAHFPLPIQFQQSPPIERLQMTIRRMSQQLTLNCQQRGHSQNYEAKQFSMLKYQNQTLKTRIKTLQQRLQLFSQQNQNSMNRSNISEQKQTKKQIQTMKSTLQQKNQQIQTLKSRIKQLSTQNEKKQNLIIDLKQQINDYKEDKNQKRQQLQTYALLQDKINHMNQQTSELVSQLQFAKQKQKKNLLKIQNLQKQLEKMMALQQRKRIGGGVLPNNSNLSLSRKTPSQKSFASEKSQKSNQSGKSNNSKTKGGFQTLINKHNQQNLKKQTTKRSSVYDSDTQSSKLRKANNTRVSPFRQTSKPSGNVSNSSKKQPTKFTSTLNRFDRNILTKGRDRSRSKSRSIKKENSPPAEIPTDNFASSSEDQRNITEALTKLQQRKNRVKMNDKKKQNEKGSNREDEMGKLQRKITNIAQMLRKAKSRQGRD